MMTNHQIMRQVYNVTVRGTDDDGSRVQSILSHRSEELRDRLSTLLDELDANDRFHIIECLEIDLGTLSMRELQDELIERLVSALTNELQRALPVIVDPVSRPETSAEQHVTHLDVSSAHLHVILYFLLHGRLPWWYQDEHASIETLMEALLTRCENTSDREPLRELMETLRRYAPARRRLVLQISDANVRRVLELISSGMASMLDEAYSVMTRIPMTREQQLDLHRRILVTAISLAVDGRTAKQTAVNISTGSELLWLSMNEHHDPVTGTMDDDDVMTENGLFVHNAGVILLHPFLQQFFRTVGVANEVGLTDPARAVLLLHHLATGELTAEEHQLAFAKVVCGLPIDLPIERPDPVTDHERHEADEMLRAVIGHWNALQQTSPDELRGNFLVRPGRIDRTDHGWYVRVEVRSYDFLIDRIPWGIGILHLPWMDRPMHVEWTT